MTTVAPETLTREALAKVLGEVFPGVPVRGDKLHGSIGSQGAVIGTSPRRTRPWSRDIQVQEPEILVQYYDKYTLEVNPEQVVDPSKIEEQAEKFRHGILHGGYVGTGAVWYFLINEIAFPDDPTGNKTRFEATVVARGNNTQLIETS